MYKPQDATSGTSSPEQQVINDPFSITPDTQTNKIKRTSTLSSDSSIPQTYYQDVYNIVFTNHSSDDTKIDNINLYNEWVNCNTASDGVTINHFNTSTSIDNGVTYFDKVDDYTPIRFMYNVTTTTNSTINTKYNGIWNLYFTDATGSAIMVRAIDMDLQPGTTKQNVSGSDYTRYDKDKIDINDGDFTYITNGSQYQGGYAASFLITSNKDSADHDSYTLSFYQFSGSKEIGLNFQSGTNSQDYIEQIAPSYDTSTKVFNLRFDPTYLKMTQTSGQLQKENLNDIIRAIDNNFRVLFYTQPIENFTYKPFYALDVNAEPPASSDSGLS